MTLHAALGKSCWWICIEDYPKALVAAAGWQQNGNSCQFYWNLTWKGIQTFFNLDPRRNTALLSCLKHENHFCNSALSKPIPKNIQGKFRKVSSHVCFKVWIKKKNRGVSLHNIHIPIIHNYIHKLYKTHSMHHLNPYDEIQFKMWSKTSKDN